MRFEVWDTTELLSVYISKKISENKFFKHIRIYSNIKNDIKHLRINLIKFQQDHYIYVIKSF